MINCNFFKVCLDCDTWTISYNNIYKCSSCGGTNLRDGTLDQEINVLEMMLNWDSIKKEYYESETL